MLQELTKQIDTANSKFHQVIKIIQDTNDTIYLTGKAGTGKSTLLNHIKETVNKNFITLTPTGIAAINIKGATIHSFFKFPLRPLLPDDKEIERFRKNSWRRKAIEKMETLIIDEVSMVRADIMDAIDCSIRKNGGDPKLPFGGKQLLLVGDLFQLEPVVTNKGGEADIINGIYKSAYFFDALIFRNISLQTIELQKIYRQSDPHFIELLGRVRNGNVTDADLDALNQRCIEPGYEIIDDYRITLTATNYLAENLNRQMMRLLETPSFHFKGALEGHFPSDRYPTLMELELKLGAQVMFVKNDDLNRYVNGSIGIISDINEDDIEVELPSGKFIDIRIAIWENYQYTWNRSKKTISQDLIGTFKQLPIKPAWAITIHKSQGLTLDKVNIDLGRGAFAGGQTYVALSRCSSLEGLNLSRPITKEDIFVDERVKEWMVGG